MSYPNRAKLFKTLSTKRRLSLSEIKNLVDKILSLQWCRDNVMVPVCLENFKLAGSEHDEIVTFAIGNYSFLGTIGDFVKSRCAESGFSCQFIELDHIEISSLIEKASLAGSDSHSEWESKHDKTKSTFKEAFFDNLSKFFDSQDDQYQLEFDDSNEQIVDDDSLLLDLELNGTELQRAAAFLILDITRSGVSDCHIEPRQEEYTLRVRRDGVMQSYFSIPRTAGIQLTACLKNMAKMDIAERRTSQDGKIRRRYEGQTIEFRCATAPGKFGEKLVMRILNSDTEMLSLDILISNDQVRQDFRSIIDEANGIIIVSGPTGSGKSTTLASALREKDTGELNIVTAEDPIEYDLGGNIQQFEVLRDKGQTFVYLLRTFLRQDPDVILIGETRDPETADSSIDAAETGHLVFTTLHANSAASSLTRLMDMEIPSYKLNTSLRGVLAQRLLRKVCPSCSVERPIDDAESRFTGLQVGTPARFANSLSSAEKQQRDQDGRLCPLCNGTGYKGRIGTYELMIINGNIRDAIKQQKSALEIEAIAVDNGMLTLKSYAVDLIAKQLTTISELAKICNT
jgi:type IV pilus assembly protein PilB